MKKIIKFGILLALTCNLSMAYSGPSGMADVVGRSMHSSAGGWAARFGHVALYNSSRKRILEVTDKSPYIREKETLSMTNFHYWGARYGRGSISQHYKVLNSGYNQRYYNPTYTLSPYYREGKWVLSWKFIPSKYGNPRMGGKLVRAWVKKNAKFRCDSFVNYCYGKGTGKDLIKWTWTTTPKRVFNTLPHRR